MKHSAIGFACMALVIGCSWARSQEKAVSKEEYMAYMFAAAEAGWNNLDADHERWRKSIDLKNVFGYNPPGDDAYLAALFANLYEITPEEKYLDRILSLLVPYGRFREAYPKDFFTTRAEYASGVPPIPNIFALPKYIHAYAVLKKHRSLGVEDRMAIEKSIAESVDFLMNFQEWGPMNRAMLRAEAFLYAAKVMPDHAHRQRWVMMGEAIARDNRTNWEIEDATGYHSVWLYSLLGCSSDIREDEEFYRTPMMHYYFNYFLALMSPAGIIPDFGDADWGSGWERMIPFFEKGAAVYHDPTLRWAAARNFRKYLDPLPGQKSIFTALALSDACRWADFSLPAKRPGAGSQQVLDDIVGKKVVLRNGWDDRSTYLLYNYRDEGDGGWLFREYLRTTITVEEEKMHHGHSDENSITLLMKNKSILLHDGGYRDFMPSGPFGAYRADYFHNRVVVRDGKIAFGQKEGEYRYGLSDRAAVPGQRMLDFFRNSGAYRPVRTQKIDFLTLNRYDMARTRLIDANLGYEADRIINYVKELDWFVVIDVVKFTRQTYLTMANLWHTRQILDHGPGWYDTAYDSLRRTDVRGDERLLIVFPDTAHLETGVEALHRYYQEEKTLYQLAGRHGFPGDVQVFVTILIPHGAKENPGSLVRQVELLGVDRYPRAIGVRIVSAGKTYIIGAKLDMQADMIRDWRRPMYSYESGKTRYGDYETDAYHLFVVEDKSTIEYAIAGGVRIRYKDQILHEQTPALFELTLDGGPPASGEGKLRYWEEAVKK